MSTKITASGVPFIADGPNADAQPEALAEADKLSPKPVSVPEVNDLIQRLRVIGGMPVE